MESTVDTYCQTPDKLEQWSTSMSDTMESGDSKIKELFLERQDKSCTKVLTYTKYTKLLKRNVPMKRTVVLQTTDISDEQSEGEQDFLQWERKRRLQQDLGVATSSKATTHPTQHSLSSFGGNLLKGQQTGSTPRREHVFAISITTNTQKGTLQATVGKGRQASH